MRLQSLYKKTNSVKAGAVEMSSCFIMLSLPVFFLKYLFAKKIKADLCGGGQVACRSRRIRLRLRISFVGKQTH